MLAAVVCMLSSSCFAAWWGTPGYEWGLSRGLTPVKSQAKLDEKVSHSDLYSTILKYLKMKKKIIILYFVHKMVWLREQNLKNLKISEQMVK